MFKGQVSVAPKGDGQILSYITIVAALIGICALLTIMMAGFAYDRGSMGLFEAFGLLRNGATAGIVGFALGLIGLFIAVRYERHFYLSLVGLACAMIAFGAPLGFQAQGRGVPVMHDITTDLDNPPPFVDIVPLRAGAPNAHEYVEVLERTGRDGSVTEWPVKEAQAGYEGYADITTIELDVPVGEAFAMARDAVLDLGWSVVAIVPQEGRIEAFDKTAFFGFIDDVVIRVQADGEDASMIDVRSKSRVGLSDVGKNAARIREFRSAL